MLKVELHIIPFGDYSNRFPIDYICIGNVGGTPQKADYHCWINSDPTDIAKENRPKPDVIIKKFKRSKGALELTRQVLNKYYAKKKEK